jgi:hypothetical protein
VRYLDGHCRLSQRLQNRVQRVANEITKRENLYAEFIMNASSSQGLRE